MESINNTTKDCGILPIECQQSKVKTIVMDINSLPSEYKTEKVKDGIDLYEKDFNIKIIPVDNSKQNTQGNHINTLLQLF